MEVFKACRLFSLHRVQEIKLTASSSDQSLACLPFISATERESLKEELPAYLAWVNDLHKDFSPLDWWKTNASVLPNWSSIAREIMLIQPSSAAAERVFSLLKASFGEQLEASLQDYVEASLMLQFNKR